MTLDDLIDYVKANQECPEHLPVVTYGDYYDNDLHSSLQYFIHCCQHKYVSTVMAQRTPIDGIQTYDIKLREYQSQIIVDIGSCLDLLPTGKPPYLECRLAYRTQMLGFSLEPTHTHIVVLPKPSPVSRQYWSQQQRPEPLLPILSSYVDLPPKGEPPIRLETPHKLKTLAGLLHFLWHDVPTLLVPGTPFYDYTAAQIL